MNQHLEKVEAKVERRSQAKGEFRKLKGPCLRGKQSRLLFGVPQKVCTVSLEEVERS